MHKSFSNFLYDLNAKKNTVVYATSMINNVHMYEKIMYVFIF